MPIPVIFPKVSLEMQSGQVARWLVADGEVVTAGQVIFEIDNDKAAVEVEAPAAGVLRQGVVEGAEVEVGAEVGLIALPGEVEGPVAAAAARAVAEAATPAKVEPQVVGARASRGPNPTPLARRIARERGVDLTGLAGTGPRGRVQKADVMAQLTQVPATPGAGLNATWLRRGEGVPVVFLHGFSADLNNWRGLFAGARPDFPVLALDLPAHGASPRAVPADAESLCAAVEDTLAAQAPGPMVLVGHSFGGAIATRLAARGRLDLRALCLIAPAGLGPEIDEPFTRGVLRARSEASLRPWLERLVHDPAIISQAFVAAVAEQRNDTGLTEAMSAFADRFFPDATQSLSVRGDLARLSLPVKVIFGRQDRILPFATTRDLPAGVALHTVDACGHLPHLEYPALVLRLIAELWRGAR